MVIKGSLGRLAEVSRRQVKFRNKSFSQKCSTPFFFLLLMKFCGRIIEPQVNRTESHTITYTWLHGHCLGNTNRTIAVYCLANTL